MRIFTTAFPFFTLRWWRKTFRPTFQSQTALNTSDSSQWQNVEVINHLRGVSPRVPAQTLRYFTETSLKFLYGSSKFMLILTLLDKLAALTSEKIPRTMRNNYITPNRNKPISVLVGSQSLQWLSHMWPCWTLITQAAFPVQRIVNTAPLKLLLLLFAKYSETSGASGPNGTNFDQRFDQSFFAQVYSFCSWHQKFKCQETFLYFLWTRLLI